MRTKEVLSFSRCPFIAPLAHSFPVTFKTQTLIVCITLPLFLSPDLQTTHLSLSLSQEGARVLRHHNGGNTSQLYMSALSPPTPDNNMRPKTIDNKKHYCQPTKLN